MRGVRDVRDVRVEQFEFRAQNSGGDIYTWIIFLDVYLYKKNESWHAYDSLKR